MDRSGLALLAGVVWVAICFIGGLRQAGGRAEARRGAFFLAAWLAGLAYLGLTRKLDHWEAFPPPAMPFLLVLLATTLALAFTRFGNLLSRHSLSALAGYQAFRVFAELGIHFAVADGIAPAQMTFFTTAGGRNGDLITALAALPVAYALKRRPDSRGLAWAFNLGGLALLANVVATGVLSLPTPFRVFLNEPANTWIARYPYILLPGMLVTAALFGHVVSLRKLLAAR